MKTMWWAVLLSVVGGCARLSAQVERIDYAVTILRPDHPAVAGALLRYAFAVNASYYSGQIEPFVVRVTLPPELEVASGCFGAAAGTGLSFDEATRVLTWSGDLDNRYLASITCPLDLRLSPAAVPGTPFRMTATLTMSKPDPNPANDTATHANIVIAASDLAVETTVDAMHSRPGSTIAYTFTVTNQGPQDAPRVALVDQLSPALDFLSFEQLDGPAATLDAAPRDAGSSCAFPRCGVFIEANIPLLTVGASASFRLTVRPKPEIEAASIRNRLIAQSSLLDPIQANSDRTLYSYIGPLADLAIAGSVGPGATASRTPVTLLVSNAGPDPVNSVTVDHWISGEPWNFGAQSRTFGIGASQGTCDEPALVSRILSPQVPPSWFFRCTVGPLAPGATATITAVVERSIAGAAQLAATITPAENDPRVQNNDATVVLTPPGPRRRTATR